MSNEIATYLKYANLQMAAEALLDRPDPEGVVGQLKYGNNRTSKFTTTQADQFIADGWVVVDHNPNTSTGFSGTLFRNRNTGELVMSFRSTEFIDDAVRDNQATNDLEIKEKGWAFGQIDDMENWFSNLKSSGKIDPGVPLTVTGYSLGGHLATAFNLLHKDDLTAFGAPLITATYTFNGAGVGQVNAGHTLQEVIDTFRQYRNAPASVTFGDAEFADVYMSIRARIDGSRMPSETDFAQVHSLIVKYGDAARPILDALQRVDKVMREQDRVTGIINSKAGPLQVPLRQIEAATLDYQVAVVLASRYTSTWRTGLGELVNDAATSAREMRGGLANMYDIYGAPWPSAVSNSQIHYGVATPIFIEDQPLWRGDVLAEAARQSFLYAGSKLLVDDFSYNDFGDTHSISLLIDSLSLQNALLQLAPNTNKETLTTLLQAASNAVAGGLLLTQGKAEGDVLENVVNSLGRLMGRDWATTAPLKGNNTGGTWANLDDTIEVDGTVSSTGRNTFYARLNDIARSDAFKDLAGKVTIDPIHPAKVDVAAPFRGTAGADVINGSAGGELFIGGKGADTISGGAGNDVFQWTTGDGNDVIGEYDTKAGNVDTLRLTDLAAGGVVLSRDTAHLYLTATATGEKITVWNHFTGTAYNLEKIEFSTGNPLLLADLNAAPYRGTTGADTITGTSSGETFIGGKGVDTTSGGAGNDFYQWAQGDGNDVIGEYDTTAGNIDTLRLTDVAAGGVVLSRDTAHLYITVTATGEKITVWNHFTGTAYNLEKIEFSSGNPLLLTDLNAAPYRGTAGADTITGTSSAELFIGGKGADVMSGGTGSDVYQFTQGDGNDVIGEYDTTAGNVDTLRFADVTSAGVQLSRDASHLYVTVTATGEKITVWNHFTSTAYHLERIEFSSGSPLLLADLNVAPFRGTAGAETITGTSGSDVFAGGLGADSLNGGYGPDQYGWSKGDGNDIISDVGDASTVVDTLKLLDAKAADVRLSRDAANLYVNIGSEKITVTNHFAYPASSALERIQFSDGTAWDGPAMVAAAALATDGNDTLFAFTDQNTTLSGLAGNDNLNTFAGNDTLDGGAGVDTLAGGAGNDLYIADNTADLVTEALNAGTDTVQASGNYTLGANVENLTLTGSAAINGTGNTLNNILTGNDAANVLDGGAGTDTMMGGLGNDSYAVDNAADVVTEAVNAGLDTVLASVNYTLSANVENLTLTGSAVNGTGNALTNTLTGNATSNALTAGDGNDVLDGQAGNDVLAGGLGNDTFLMGRGYGADTLQENDKTAGNTDVLQFMAGIGADQLWFRKAGNDLEAGIIGTADKAIVQNWYLGDRYHVEQIKAGDGKLLLDTQVDKLVQAMAGFTPPAMGQTALTAAQQTALAPVLAANWH